MLKTPCERPGPAPRHLLSLTQFRQLFPRLSAEKAEAFLPYFLAGCREAEIDSPQRLAYFAAQLGHESIDLTRWEEIDPKGENAARYDVGATAKRLGNTPERDGDGALYRGRGPIQLTGRANYRAAGKALGLPLEAEPHRAAWLDTGFRVAAWFWRSRGLNHFADLGAFDEVTRRINGGDNGAADRRRRLARALAVLGCE